MLCVLLYLLLWTILSVSLAAAWCEWIEENRTAWAIECVKINIKMDWLESDDSWLACEFSSHHRRSVPVWWRRWCESKKKEMKISQISEKKKEKKDENLNIWRPEVTCRLLLILSPFLFFPRNFVQCLFHLMWIWKHNKYLKHFVP